MGRVRWVLAASRARPAVMVVRAMKNAKTWLEAARLDNADDHAPRSTAALIIVALVSMEQAKRQANRKRL